MKRANVYLNFRGGLKHPITYDRLILLIRDPFDTFISEWNRQNSGKHTGLASEKSFENKKKWEDFIEKQLKDWEEFYVWQPEHYRLV